MLDSRAMGLLLAFTAGVVLGFLIRSLVARPPASTSAVKLVITPGPIREQDPHP